MSWPYSRITALAVSMVASAVFFLPLTAAFSHADIAWTFKVLLGVLLASSAARPSAGLLMAVLTLPFAAALEYRFGGIPAGAEITDAVLLAFVCGASLRAFRADQREPSRLAAPALVLVAAVIASTIGELRGIQAITPREPIVGDLWRHVTTSYWTAPQQFIALHLGVRWTAWLASAVYVERLVRALPIWRAFVLRGWIVAGLTVAFLSVVYLLRIVLAQPEPFLPVLLSELQHVRLSVLQPDLNAAGSYFALFLVPAIVVGIHRRLWGLLCGVVPVIGLAFVLARSRAAIAAVVLVLCAAYGIRMLGRERPRQASIAAGRAWGAVSVAVFGAVALALMLAATTESHVSPRNAVQIRAEMTEVALDAARRYPLFGVGLGDYIRMTRRLITPEMPLLYGFAPDGENAHNNFLQIAVELGIPAGLVFLWLVVPSAVWGFRRVNDGRPVSTELRGMSLGVAAFLISALFGHPLLIAQVGAPFFIALGITAGLAPVSTGRSWPMDVAWGVAAFYAVTLVWR